MLPSTTYCSRHLAALIGGTSLLAGTLLAAALAAPAPSSSHASAQQVAETLDSLVQPRFQNNAGRFGIDRVVFGGHDNIYGLSAEGSREKRLLGRVNAAHRPYVIAFLHCVHKPGEDLLTKTRDKDTPFKPYLQTLAMATSTQAGTDKLMVWSDANLEKVVLPFVPTLKQGIGASREFGNWQVVMRPVRASRESCLGCHAGAKRSETLGVMVYAVDKERIRATIKSFQEDGG